MIFALHQWLELAAIIVIPLIVGHFITKGVCALENRRQARWQKRCDCEMAALQEKIGGMAD